MAENSNNTTLLCDAFRAQLVLPEQLQLYDYWHASAQADGTVLRSKINPSDIPLLLPSISLLEFDQDLQQFKFRLAGTGLRDVYGRDVTGFELSQIFSGGAEKYWHRTCSRVLETGMPSQGIVRGPQHDKENLVQFWLRLPLRLEMQESELILGLDMCLSAGQSSEILEVKHNIEDIDIAL